MMRLADALRVSFGIATHRIEEIFLEAGEKLLVLDGLVAGGRNARYRSIVKNQGFSIRYLGVKSSEFVSHRMANRNFSNLG
jgi:hypothetical protein